MRWPLVSRALFEEVSCQRDELRRELNRWQDVIAKQNWGQQIHDSIPMAQVAAEPLTEPIPEAQATEEEMQEEYQRDQARLQTIARTRKSQLPQAIEQLMSHRIVQRAKAAVSKPAIAARFEKLKAETLKSIQ